MTIPRLSPRGAEAHKGTFGHVLIVGGIPGMAGASALAGLAALRSGAGLVTVACSAASQAVVAAIEPSYMTVGLPAGKDGAITPDAIHTVRDLARTCHCLAIGPGLGRSTATRAFVADVYQQLAIPLVVDADALNALAAGEQWISRPPGKTVLTPHPGEFRRLVGNDQLDIPSCRQTAPAWAQERDLVLVLKGHRTLVTDGTRSKQNSTGNPGMATGGSGDVLTGVVAALIAQGMSTWDAARLGVYVHGLAGDLAARQLGEVSVIASDLPTFLPSAFLQVQQNQPGKGGGGTF